MQRGVIQKLKQLQQFSKLPHLLGVVVFLLVLLSGTLTLPAPFSGYNGQRWMALLFLAAVIGAKKGMPANLSPQLLAVLFLMLASTAWAPFFIDSVAVSLTFVALAWLGWRCALEVKAQPMFAMRFWCAGAAACAFLYSAIVLVGIVTLLAIGQFDSTLLFHGFINRRFFLQITTPLLPCLLVLSRDAALPLRYRGLAALGSLLWVLLIWLNDGSGAIFAILLGVLAAVVLLGKRALPLGGLVLGFLLLGWGIMTLAGHWLPLQAALQEATHPTANLRMLLWQRAFDGIIHRPFLGWGGGGYAHFTHVANAHPHNLLLSWAVSYGLPSLLLVGWLGWRVFRPIGMRARLGSLPLAVQPYAIAITIGAMSGLAHANASGLIVMPMAQIVLVVTLGLWAGLLGKVVPTAQQRYARPIRILLAGAMLISAMLSMQQNCAFHPLSSKERPVGYCAATPAFWAAYPAKGSINPGHE